MCDRSAADGTLAHLLDRSGAQLSRSIHVGLRADVQPSGWGDVVRKPDPVYEEPERC
jgi:hypothetical protein